jgi:hypothetical protein
MAGPQRTIHAFDLAFVDDDHVLVLRPAATSEDSLELAVEPAEASERGDAVASWRRTIPAYYAPTLSLDRATGTWRVTAYDVTVSAAVTTVGKIGSDNVKTTQLSGTLGGGRPLHTYRDGTSLITTLRGSQGRHRMLLVLLGFHSFQWEVWRVTDGERRSAGVLPGLPECGGRDDALLCVVRGRAVTVWQLGAGVDATPRPIAVLPTKLDLWDIAADGRIAAASYDGTMLAIVDAGLGRGTRIALGGGVQLQSAQPVSTSHATDLAVAPGIVALLVVRGGMSEVRLYRVK